MRRWVPLFAIVGCSDPSPPVGPVDAGTSDVPQRVCEPAVVECSPDANAPRTCRPDGRGWDLGASCSTSRGEVGVAGRGALACAEAERRREARGCSFHATQTLHRPLGRQGPQARRDDFPFALVVSNPWPVELRATVSGGALAAPRSVTVRARDAAVVELPWQPALVDGVRFPAAQSALTRGVGLRVQTTLPATVYQFNPLRFEATGDCERRDPDACYSYSGDGSLVIPDHALGDSHMALTLPTQRTLPAGNTEWTVGPGFIAVVGTRAGTRLTVRLAGASAPGDGIEAGRPGETRSFTLGDGDVLQLLSPVTEACSRDRFDRPTEARFCIPDATEDLTGTTLRASAPVAVFVGHDCAQVPFDRFACDHLEESLPPVTSLGRQYGVARVPPVLPRSAGEPPEGEPTITRVLALRDATEITFAPATVHAPLRLDAGRVVEVEFRDDFVLSASSPVLVATFCVGGDWLASNLPVNRYSLGDPSLAFETPVEQYRHAYELLVPGDFPRNHATVVVPRGARVLVDGRALAASPRSTVGVRDFWSVQLPAGAHRVEVEAATARAGLRLQGVAPFTSYMLSGGGDLTSIAPPL